MRMLRKATRAWAPRHPSAFASKSRSAQRAAEAVARADPAAMLLAVLLACAAWATRQQRSTKRTSSSRGTTGTRWSAGHSDEHGSEHGSEQQTLHGPPPRADGEYSAWLMARMRNGGDGAGLTEQSLSSNEQGMLIAMADQFKAMANPTRSQLAAHGGRDLPKPSASGGATTARSITLTAQGGSVTASELDGKVQLQLAPGTDDGGIRLLSAWARTGARMRRRQTHPTERLLGSQHRPRGQPPGACPGAPPAGWRRRGPG